MNAECTRLGHDFTHTRTALERCQRGGCSATRECPSVAQPQNRPKRRNYLLSDRQAHEATHCYVCDTRCVERHGELVCPNADCRKYVAVAG